MSKHNSFEGAPIFGDDRASEHHVFLDSKIIEKYHAEFGNVFSVKALSFLAEGDPTLTQDVDVLITRSHIYAGDVLLLQEMAEKTGGTVEGMQGLLDRQQEAHTEFTNALTNLFLHATERGKAIPFDIQGISRIRSSQIALFIAYDDERAETLQNLDSKSA